MAGPVTGDTVVALFRARAARSASRVALRQKHDGQWVATTWQEWERASTRVAAALVRQGLAPAERVAVIASSRVEWAIADLGVQLAGGTTVPLYTSQTPADAAQILADTAPRFAIVEDLRPLELLAEVRATVPSIERVFVIDPVRRLPTPDARGRIELSIEPLRAADPALSSWVRPFSELTSDDDEALAEVARRAEAVRPEDLCTIVPSSGTTGSPRGVVLTQQNLAAVLGALGDLGVGEGDEQLLLLPLAHVFGRLLLLGALPLGYTTAFATSPQAAVQESAEVRPTFLGSAPRLYEKVHQIVDAGARGSGQVRRGLYRWARQVGGAVARLRQRGRAPEGLLAVQHRYANRLVLGRIRARFGGRLRFFFSGAAPLAPETWRFFEAAGLPILEGYGLTEAAGLTTVTRPGRGRPGSVGQPIAGVEVRLAADGEILVRGPTVMRGYWNRPEDTAAVLDADGWLHTGDVGVLDADGTLSITDRKKDIIVTSKGRNVAPQALERELSGIEPIGHAVVVGDARPHLVALVAVDRAALRAWATRQGLARDLAPDAPPVREAVARGIAALNGRVAPHERILAFALLPDELSAEAGELTSTGKVNRRVVVDRRADLVERLYEPFNAGDA